MPFKVEIRKSVMKTITSWQLSDFMLVEVYLQFREVLPMQPSMIMRRATSPFDGMVFEFQVVDPENRLREHIFTFQIVYSQDEETLIIAKAGYERRDGV